MTEEKKFITNEPLYVQSYNKHKMKAKTSLQKVSLGKGKIAKTLDTILIGAAAIFETIRELPGFEYLKTMSISNLTTKFNNWIASLTNQMPDLTGLTPEQIYQLGQQNQLAGSNQVANTWGLLFSAVLEFVVQHPTVAVIGIAALTGVLAIPFKVLINKIRSNKQEKLEEKGKAL